MRIGQVGYGRWGKHILRDLLSLGAEVIVATPSADSQQAALEKGAVGAVADASSLPSCDGYVVAVPSSLHFDIIKVLLPRGVPIFVEKPLTIDAEQAAWILEQAPERVFCMDKWRYHGGVLKLAELAKSGTLGQIRGIQNWRLGWGNPHRDVNSLWILAPHDLSIALEILGELPSLVSASAIQTATDESVTALLHDQQGGPHVEIQVSFLHPVNRRSVVVIGSEASAQFGDSYDSMLRLNRRGHEPEEIPVNTDMPLLAELRAFVKHLDGGPPPKSSAADAELIVRRLAEIETLSGLPSP